MLTGRGSKECDVRLAFDREVGRLLYDIGLHMKYPQIIDAAWRAYRYHTGRPSETPDDDYARFHVAITDQFPNGVLDVSGLLPPGDEAAIENAYRRYDSDGRVSGPDTFDAFRDAVLPFFGHPIPEHCVDAPIDPPATGEDGPDPVETVMHWVWALAAAHSRRERNPNLADAVGVAEGRLYAAVRRLADLDTTPDDPPAMTYPVQLNWDDPRVKPAFDELVACMTRALKTEAKL